MIVTSLEGVTMAKGHVCGADYLIVPDPGGQRRIAAADVASVCDRATGVGASGLLRLRRDDGWIVDTYDAHGATRPAGPHELLMAAHYLRVMGLADDAVDGAIEIAVPGNPEPFVVAHDSQGYTVAAGDGSIPGGMGALTQGYDVAVTAHGLEGMRGGLRVSLAGEHIVVALSDDADLAAVNLTQPVLVDPPQPGDVTVTFVVPQGEDSVEDFDGQVRTRSVMALRTVQLGVGNAAPAGPAAAAAALALQAWAEGGGPSLYRAVTSQGDVHVRLAGSTFEVTAQADIVAEVTFTGIAGEGRG